ncbi:MAG: hypothetical protein WD009_08395 [Phycisphaeraceae bacterium]
MMMLRKFLKFLRGSVAPYQVYAACILGGLIGFMPGFMQAPGLIVVLTLLLILLNASFFLAGLTGLIAGLLSLVLLPVTFQVGRLLLDGPTQGLFQPMINAPGLALLGLDYYATTGGIPLGILTGIVVAVIILKLLRTFRTRMANLEEGSERYKQWTSKKWVKALTWILAGGGPKQGYKALVESRAKFKPLRPLGLAVAAGAVVLGIIAHLLLSGPIVTAALAHGLERANGATVDLRSADLSLRHGRLVIEDLAMADPNALETDIFRAARVEANLSVADLLRKRMTIDALVASGASSGQARAVRGARTRSAPQPAPAPDPDELEPDEKTIEDYIADARQWRERLAQVRRWLEAVMGPGDPPDTQEQRETLRERLARRAAELGYANVRAEHLVDRAPTLLIRHMQAEGVSVAQLEDETLDIQAYNISTHAHLVDEPPRITVASSGGTLLANLSLDGAAAGGAGQANHVQLSLAGISGDRVGQALRVGDTQPVRDGRVDLVTDGTFSRAGIDLPLHVTLHDTTLTVPGVASHAANRFDLALGVRGQLDAPIITLDNQQLADALIRAGADQLAAYVDEQVTERVEQEVDRARERATEEVDRAREEARGRIEREAGRQLRGLFGGDDDE